MKTILVTGLACAISLNTLLAQTKPAPIPVPIAADDKTVSYQVAERGPHHKVVQRVTWTTDAKGNAVAQTNSYTELATGMHYQEGDKWLESEAKIEILANNTGAVASKGQHKAIFPPEIKSGVIELNTPDNQWLRSRIWGLAYFDASTGDSLLLAEVQASDGQLVGDNMVIYPNAFTDFRADIRYTYTLAGFEQDVVLREQPPSPKEFGLNPETTRLQVLTEFVEAPVPAKESRQTDGITDESLSFGQMGIGPGKAFSVDAAGDTAGQVPVAKGWTPIEGRNFLIEEVHYDKVMEQLQKLPAAGKYQGASLLRRGTGENVIAGLKKLMPKRYAKTAPKPGTKRMAKVPASSSPSFVMDYLVTLTSQANFTFKGDTTYYVSSTVNLSGTTTIEGGTVVKYTNSASAIIGVGGALVCQTGPYRPAVFTSKNDNSVGETISGSTGSPSINTNATYLSASANSNPFKYLHFRYAGSGLAQSYRPVWHCQFLQCGNAIKGDSQSSYGATMELHNVLFSQCNVAVSNSPAYWYGSCLGIVGEQVTVDQVGALMANTCYYGGPASSLTNSILTGVGSLGATVTLVNSINLSTNTGIYATVGAGNYYLAASSTNRNAGAANLNATLLTELKSKTTYPPVVYSNVTISAATTWPIQAARDTDTPDLGYHYDPLDYCVGGVTVSSTLTLTNGAAVGIFGPYGIQSGTVVSVGTPTNNNHIALYSAVQEQSTVWGTNASATYLFNSWNSGTRFRFTDIALGGSAGVCSSSSANSLEMRDCILRAAKLYIGGSYYATLGFTNNIVERCDISLLSCFGYDYYAHFYNNLFLNTTNLSFGDTCNQNIITNFAVKNNLFVGSSFTYGTSSGYTPQIFNNGFCNTTVTSQGTAAKTISNPPDFKAGPLGSYYYPTTGTNLYQLIDAGSLNATNLGMYHYTTTTNQVKEANSTVDIGYHYLAVNSGNGPLDSDGDGLPDYLEDVNGNGTTETNETSYTNPDTDYDGRSDYQELQEGTNPLDSNSAANALLGRWSFDNTNSWVGDQGQALLGSLNAYGQPSPRTNAVFIYNTNGAYLAYRDVETNGYANINCQRGTLRYWFKPDWTSTSSGGIGPTNYGTMVWLGVGTPSFWGMSVAPDGNSVYLYSSGPGGNDPVHCQASINWYSNTWHQVVVTYSASTSKIYVDGQLGATGSGITNFPNATQRANGLLIGTSSGGNQCRGAFEELETFNYELSASEIANSYDVSPFADADGDGISDKEDADPNNPVIGRLRVIIETPVNGSVIY